MKLSREDQQFRDPRVFYPDPKAVELDRVLVRLFLLLRCKGMRPTSAAMAPAEWDQVAHHRGRLAQHGANEGFATHTAVAQAWLESDVFDVVNRGKGREGKEAIASLRPLHLDSAKIHIAARCRDYAVADHLYASLEAGEARIVDALRAYLDRGRDAGPGAGAAKLDLETLAVLKLVDDVKGFFPSSTPAAPFPPVCVGQGRVLCDDVGRLLAYQDAVPRAVMIEYLRAIFGLHTAIYTLRLARQLPGWVADKRTHDACRKCPVKGDAERPFEGCPYQTRFLVDMGDDFRSPMARMAQASAGAEWGRMEDLIRAVFTVNQLMRYAKTKGLSSKDSPSGAVDLLGNPPPTFDGFFEALIDNVRSANTTADGALPPEVEAILAMDASPFERFIELITHVRYRHHRDYLNQMLDKLFQKNTEYGATAQGKSASNPRRWHLGPRLLEVFVQIAVLKVEYADGKKRYVARPLLIDDFVRGIEDRYGFVLAGTMDPAVPPTLAEHTAFRQNLGQLKTQLREIGFFDDLSDAFNAQTIRPRYPISTETAE